MFISVAYWNILLWTLQGPGVAGARVIVDSKLQATTSDDGVYHLDSMKSGTYQLQIEAPRMSFDVATVKVTPNTPQLPDIIVARLIYHVLNIIESLNIKLLL